MSIYHNDLGQSTGFPVNNWKTCPRPPRSGIEGRSCRVEAYNPDQHNTDLFDAFARDIDHANWTYLPYGPFDDFDSFDAWARSNCQGDDPLFHTVIDRNTGQAIGMASYLRITPDVGVIEVGHIHFSPLLQRTTLSTEAMFLMMKRVFDELGYRRYEWKCDALNAPSCKSAQRLGFQHEGIFRQATLYKNRNRDTAWYSILDNEWPEVRGLIEAWLEPGNFGDDGSAKTSLYENMQDRSLSKRGE